MNPPRHFVSAAAIVINDNNEILLIKGPKRGWEMPGGQLTITNESLETKYFSIEEGLSKVTWNNFRQRIEYCLSPDSQPFYIEF